MNIIKRNEKSFREKAANELFAEGGYMLFLVENQEFDHIVNDMHLGLIAFEADFPDGRISLGYEYGAGLGMEHDISISLTWDEIYRYARSG